MSRQFPPEIVQLIVEASLDPYDIFTSLKPDIHARYATLKSYSRLNSTWYGASQPNLFRSIELPTDESVEEFLELAERRGGTVEGVRDLWIERISDGDFSTLQRLFKSTPHLLNFSCYGGTMNVGDLAQLQRLRQLDSGSHFLTPAFLPQLRRIDTDDLDRIAPLIPQLEIVTSEYGYDDYTLLSPAKSLLLLPVPLYSQDRLVMFSTLPSLPPFLHIHFRYTDGLAHGVALALEELLEAKNPGLRIILLNDHGIDERAKSLIQRLSERGIRVQMVDKGLNFDGAIVEMYRIRAKEQRAVEGSELRGR